MNDNRIYHIGLLFLSAFLLSSCAQEEPTGRGVTVDADEILFITTLPGVETRSNHIIDGESIKDGFFVSAGNMEDLDAKGKPSVFFTNELVTHTEGMGNAFRSEKCKWPSNKDDKMGKLRFFAFYPSRDDLKNSADLPLDAPNFELTYNEVKDGSKVKYEYWMKKFKVNKDISRHSDFVTATVDGSKTENLYSGVNLALQHQLSGINLLAYGNSDSYDVEIAGVRIGGVAIESDFSFEGKPVRDNTWNNTRVGRWTGVIDERGSVEYIFREGDTVVPINKESHPDSISAVSIMGNGGRAMIIPYDYKIWKEYKTNKNQKQDSLYFSVLLRVKERASGKNSLLYPYIEGVNINSSVTTDGMNVVYLSVETSTGTVKKRLYRNKTDKKFYTDTNFEEEYTKPDTEEIRNYGWASAIPYIGEKDITTMRFNPGYQYYYRLNYTNGIGIQDPADASPGEAIIYPVEVTGTSRVWHTVEKLENIELELEVEK